MKYNGVIAKKIEQIEERLLKLQGVCPLNTNRLQKDFFLKSGIERTLQVCIEAMIDISERIIALEGLSPATTAYNALKKIEDLGVIQSAEKYKKMVQFRNFIVHRYESIDNAELVYICNTQLDDFNKFIKEIRNYE